MKFIKPTEDRVERLKRALHSVAAGDGATLLQQPGTGEFDRLSEEDDLDRSVINAIKSVPVHY